jgi:predicted AAA+ superfamily ATPase
VEYVPRIADSQLTDRLAGLGAVLIEGPKGSGKTRTARQRAASEVLLEVDRNAVRAVAVDPRLILEGPAPRLIDEWQREPRVWDAVRRAVDDRWPPGQFILTGSAQPTNDVPRHSGAGRFSVMRMRPMTLLEQGYSSGEISLAALMSGDDPAGTRCRLDLNAYIERILVGGWPQVLGAGPATATAFVRDYVARIIEHDISVVSGGRRDPRLVRRFLHAYAQLTAHPARLSTIVERARSDGGRAEGAPGPTRGAAEGYLHALRRMMIVDEVEGWGPALRSRTRFTSVPKRHLVDPSLAASLMGCTPVRLLGDIRTLEGLFEALATRDLRIYAEAQDDHVYHYQEHAGGLGVDLVIAQANGGWAGFQVRLGGALIDEAAATLTRMATTRAAHPPMALAVITASGYGYRRLDGVWVIPLGCLGP